MRDYRYDLGFAVNGVPIPDPAGFSGETSDLDTSAERDATGLLHRNWVAQKVPLELSYTNIDWRMCETILKALNHASFQFTYPDPNVGRLRTGTYYVGNRKWKSVWMPAGEGPAGWYVDLTFSVIEY
jgi:hypothetical protein